MLNKCGISILFIAMCISAQPGAFSLTSPINGGWGSPTATFTWGASAAAVSYRLFVDGVLTTDNLASRSYQLSSGGTLTEGLHTWYVVAVDVGNAITQSTQTFTVRVDGTPPVAFNLVSPLNNSWTNDIHPLFKWTPASDAGSGMQKYELWVDGAKASVLINNLVNQEIPKALDSAEYSGFLSRGPHTWQIKAIDSVGNVRGSSETRTVNIDYDTPLYRDIVVSNPILSTTWGGYAPDSWGIFDAFNQRLIFGDIDRGTPGGFNTIVYTFSPGKYVFAAYANTGWNGSCSFTISGAVKGDGTYYVRPAEGYSLGRNVPFTVGIDGTNKFKPGSKNVPYFTSNPLPTFSWISATDTGAGLLKYQLYIDDLLVKDNLRDTVVTITSALGFGLHKWYVSAIDSANNATPMFPLQFYIDNVPPRPFSLKSPGDSSFVSIPTPTLSWQAASDSSITGGGVKKYQIWINNQINIDSISDTTTAPQTILSEGTYHWFVKAFDAAGNMRQSAQTRTFYIDYNPPQRFKIVAPSNGDTISTSKPRFTWYSAIDNGSGIKRYILNISGVAPDTIAADTSFKTTKTLANGSYSWYVIAYDRVNNSAASDTGTFLVNIQQPTAPTLTGPANGTINQTSLISLLWNELPNADSYDLQISADSGFTILADSQSGGGGTTYYVFTDCQTKLSRNVHYYWRVRAVNTVGKSEWSEIWNFTTSTVLLLPDSDAVIVTDSVRLAWHRSLGLNRYWLEVAKDPLMKNIILSDSTIADSLKTIGGLQNGTSYWWRIRGQCLEAGGYAYMRYYWGNPSEKRMFTTNMATTAILPINNSCILSGMLKSGGLIKYGLPAPSQVSIKLYNIQGQLLKVICDARQSAGYHQIQVDFANISKGSYLMDFRADGYAVRKRVNRL